MSYNKVFFLFPKFYFYELKSKVKLLIALINTFFNRISITLMKSSKKAIEEAWSHLQVTLQLLDTFIAALYKIQSEDIRIR